MNNTIKLHSGYQVKTNQDKYETVFTVGTVEARCGKEGLERALSLGHELAWINAQGATLTGDYEGKAQDMANARQAYDNAIELTEGQHVILEGREYTVEILPNHEDYSDGIKLIPFANHPYVLIGV